MMEAEYELEFELGPPVPFNIGKEMRITFSDENGPKGGKDIRCNLSLKLEHWGEIFTTAIHKNTIGASVRSVGKARRKLVSRKNTRLDRAIAR